MDEETIYKEAIARHQSDIDTVGKILGMSAVVMAISNEIGHDKGISEHSDNFDRAKTLAFKIGVKIGEEIIEALGKK
jgi:hypothetical protein